LGVARVEQPAARSNQGTDVCRHCYAKDKQTL
jgi:hypothetical protein